MNVILLPPYTNSVEYLADLMVHQADHVIGAAMYDKFSPKPGSTDSVLGAHSIVVLFLEPGSIGQITALVVCEAATSGYNGGGPASYIYFMDKAREANIGLRRFREKGDKPQTSWIQDYSDPWGFSGEWYPLQEESKFLSSEEIANPVKFTSAWKRRLEADSIHILSESRLKKAWGLPE